MREFATRRMVAHGVGRRWRCCRIRSAGTRAPRGSATEGAADADEVDGTPTRQQGTHEDNGSSRETSSGPIANSRHRDKADDLPGNTPHFVRLGETAVRHRGAAHSCVGTITTGVRTRRSRPMATEPTTRVASPPPNNPPPNDRRCSASADHHHVGVLGQLGEHFHRCTELHHGVDRHVRGTPRAARRRVSSSAAAAPSSRMVGCLRRGCPGVPRVLPGGDDQYSSLRSVRPASTAKRAAAEPVSDS